MRGSDDEYYWRVGVVGSAPLTTRPLLTSRHGMTRRRADEEENCGEAVGRAGSTTGPVCSVPSQRLRCHRTRQKNEAKEKKR
jgi:hypothetical protein